jgi:uncharacterized protein (DUF305 family)
MRFCTTRAVRPSGAGAARVIGIVVMAVALSACGRPGSPESAPSAPAEPVSSIHNSQDVMFAQQMIPHHQQAVDMSKMVPSHSANPTLQTVAIHIQTDQRAEISLLTDFLTRWGEPVAGHAPMPMAMDGMVDPATMNRLQTLTGTDFDTLWITSMISHHQGAVTMAEAELAHGQSPDALKAARLMITAQKREISYLTDLIASPT